MSEIPDERLDARPAATRGGSGPSAELTTDELFNILQSERRRLALRHLLDREGPTDVETLATAVAAAEQDTTSAELPDEARQRTYLDLYQSHLPKLDHLDLVDYEQGHETVEPTPAVDLFEPYLDGPLAPDPTSAGSGFPGSGAGSASTDATAEADDGGDATTGTRDSVAYYAGTALVSAGLFGVAALGTLSPVVLSFRVVASLVTAMYAALTAGLVLSPDH